MDTVSKTRRSEIMRKVKGKETKLEKLLRSALWKEGFRYKKNNSSYFGKPDLIVGKRKLILFIDSCFWHGCKEHLRMPSSNKNYWEHKIKRNIERDAAVNKHYKNTDWKVLRIWEHELKTQKIVDKLVSSITHLSSGA